MNGTSFKLDMSLLQNFIEGVNERVKHPSPLMEEIGEILKSNTIRRLKRGITPEGKAQTPLASRTGIPLHDTGENLMRSITYAAGVHDVTIGTNFEGAALHQFGGDYRKSVDVTLKNGTSFKRRLNIPARPYLGISKEDEEEIKEAIPHYYFTDKDKGK